MPELRREVELTLVEAEREQLSALMELRLLLRACLEVDGREPRGDEWTAISYRRQGAGRRVHQG